MDLKLTITCEVEGSEKAYDLEFSRDLITIGRHSMNDVQIPDMQVSAEHARILAEDDKAFLVDLGSSLGTELNGKRVGPHQRTAISDGDVLRIASYRLVVSRPQSALDDTASEKTAMVAMRMVREVLGSLSAEDEPQEEPPWLEVLNDIEVGTRLDLTETREYRVGREKTGDLILKHWSISRRHALFRRDAEGVTVLDMGSKNGVLVNDQRITESHRLRDGDKIGVGHTEVLFHNPARRVLDSMDVSRTPVTDLKELGIDAPHRNAAPRPESRAPEPAPRPEPEPEPRREPRPESGAPARDVPAGRPRPGEPDTTFADYLPMIVGGVFILGAIVAALFLFVL